MATSPPEDMGGKVCVVTGGASGIGAAIARQLAARGAIVFIGDRDGNGLEAVVAEIRASGGQATGRTCDVTSHDDMVALVDIAVARGGRLDVIYNNAGIPDHYPLETIDLAAFDRIMHVNVYGVILGCQAALPVMRRQGGGRVINTCSIAGRKGYPGSSLYSASKFAVRGLTQSYAQELGRDGITVNAICPGIVETPIWDEVGRLHAAQGETGRTGADILRGYGGAAALGRIATPDDIASVAVFMATDAASYMTGQCVIVDGGIVFD